MGKLVGITMVGIDEHTPFSELERLQAMDERVEFGVIMSKNWSENGNRYMNPDFFKYLKDRGLNLSLHLCGSVARAAIQNDWGPAFNLLGDNASLFNRVQLNIKGYRDSNPRKLELTVPEPFKEIIIQQHAVYDCALFYEWFLRNPTDSSISVLIDGSGGQGLESKIIPLYKARKAGYAGGLGPHNIFSTTCNLLNNIIVHDFWVDMESGVRTDDWFDIKKAEKVIEEVHRAENYDDDEW